MLTPERIEAVRAVEVTKLDDLEKSLNAEYEGGDLTSAQRMTALQEIRRIVWLRSVLNGLIEVSGSESGREG